MSDTLNDCLSLQKIEEHKMEIVKKQFTMGALVKGATLAVKGSADAKSISIVVDSTLDMNVDKGSLIYNSESVLDRYYIGDQFRLEHVVMNFLSNAIKFSPDASTITIVIRGKERREVRSTEAAAVPKTKLISRAAASRRVGSSGPSVVSAEVDVCDVTLVVQDQGVGISKADQAQLFQAYSQVKADKLQRGMGSGLGLLLAKEIINLHGGQVVLESDEGKGSSFGFCIPFEVITKRGDEESKKSRAKGELEANTGGDMTGSGVSSGVSGLVGMPGSGPGPGEGKSGGAGGAGGKGESKKAGEVRATGQSTGMPLRVPAGTKFLIVDDTASNRKMLAMVLQGYGVACEYAQNGQEALDKVTGNEKGYYEVIFMDQEMPIMNGIESTTKIRTAGYANLILGLTGNALDEDKHLFLAAGADCIFAKPLRQVHIDAILEHTGLHGFKSHVGKKYHAMETLSRRLQLQTTNVRPPATTGRR
jgi:osomolarity two-component system sensor histidine kinase SLN1